MAEHYLHRPYIRKQVKNKADNKEKKIDPYNKQAIVNPQLGHKPSYEYSKMRDAAEKVHMSQKEFNHMMNQSKMYVWQDRSSNASTHENECHDAKIQRAQAFKEIRSMRNKPNKHQNSKSQQNLRAYNKSLNNPYQAHKTSQKQSLGKTHTNNQTNGKTHASNHIQSRTH